MPNASQFDNNRQNIIKHINLKTGKELLILIISTKERKYL